MEALRACAQVQKLNVLCRDGAQVEALCVNPRHVTDEAMLNDILDDYCQLTRLLFTSEQDIRSEHRAHAFCTDLLLLIHANMFQTAPVQEPIVAAVTFKQITTKTSSVLYINAALIHPILQGKGVLQGILKAVVKEQSQLFPVVSAYAGGRTQNVCFAKAMRRIFGSVYPLDLDNLSEKEQAVILQQGQDVAQQLGMTIYNRSSEHSNPPPTSYYDTQTMLCRKVYLGMQLMKDVPRIPDSQFNSLIDMDDGDALLLLCPLAQAST
mgnify:CR=1 FL=1